MSDSILQGITESQVKEPFKQRYEGAEKKQLVENAIIKENVLPPGCKIHTNSHRDTAITDKKIEEVSFLKEGQVLTRKKLGKGKIAMTLDHNSVDLENGGVHVIQLLKKPTD